MALAQAKIWSCAAWVVAKEHTTSITATSSLELTCMCSGECCAVYDRPGVSAGAAAIAYGGGDGGDISGGELLSISTSGV